MDESVKGTWVLGVASESHIDHGKDVSKVQVGDDDEEGAVDVAHAALGCIVLVQVDDTENGGNELEQKVERLLE